MIPVTKPHVPAKENFDKYISQAFDSKVLTNAGPLVQELTSRLKSYLGVRNLLLVGNGTLGLQLGLKLCGLVGEVLTTPFSFPATSSSLVWEGGKPIFCDIDSEDYNVALPDQLDDQTDKAIGMLFTHVFGCPVNSEKVRLHVEKKNLPVVFDAAHAFGVTSKGESVLNFGDISVLS